MSTTKSYSRNYRRKNKLRAVRQKLESMASARARCECGDILVRNTSSFGTLYCGACGMSFEKTFSGIRPAPERHNIEKVIQLPQIRLRKAA